MAGERQDLRVKKTQRLLATAMLTLLEKRTFAKITVNDICTEAMISRTAFYSHFADKYDLLNFCMQALQQSVFEERSETTLRGKIRSALELVAENVKIFRNLLMSDLDTEVIEMMRRAFHESFEQLLCEHELDKDSLPGPPELISVYYASGIASVIVVWIKDGMVFSIDDVTSCLCALLPEELLER